MINILEFKFISDTHNIHHQLEVGSCDVLVHAGDACTKGNFTEGKDFLMWFVKQKAKYKVYVPGNHDGRLRADTAHPDLVKLAEDLGITVLDNSGITIEGIKIYGVSATFKEHGKATKNGYIPSITERINAWKDIPSGLRLLITHMPPYGILDTTRDGRQIGCQMLLKKVQEVKPTVHTFGHIHEQGHRTAELEHTQFYNVSCLDLDYILRNHHYKLYLHA